MLSGTQLRKIPKERHHHWPRCVQDFWVAADGKVSRLECNGAISRRVPIETALITDGHRAKLEGPWDSTIEPLFDEPDDNFKRVINALSELETLDKSFKADLHKRLLAQPISDGLRSQLGECLASLIVRSLAFRDQLWITAADARAAFGFSNDISRVEKTSLIVGNMSQQYGGMKQSLSSGGKLVVLFSPDKEFIFGDGFLHTIWGDTFVGQKFLIPLTPSMCVAFCSPIAYRTNPNLMTMRVSPEEVGACNFITQVYTKDYLYFRNEQPEITEQFARRQFLQFEEHRHPWLDWLLAGIATH